MYDTEAEKKLKEKWVEHIKLKRIEGLFAMTKSANTFLNELEVVRTIKDGLIRGFLLVNYQEKNYWLIVRPFELFVGVYKLDEQNLKEEQIPHLSLEWLEENPYMHIDNLFLSIQEQMNVEKRIDQRIKISKLIIDFLFYSRK